MVRRVLWIWIGTVAAWAVLVFGYSRRTFRLDSIVDPSQGEAGWSFPWDLFLWGAVGFALLFMVAMILPTMWIVNQRRARKLFADDSSAVITGVRNYHRSLASGGPLAKVRRLGHFSNVLVARGPGILLMGGVFKLRIRWETSWAAIEAIDQFVLTPKTHHVAGAGVSMSVKGYSIPLEFALVSSRFPWGDVAVESEVSEAIDQLRGLRNAVAGTAD